MKTHFDTVLENTPLTEGQAVWGPIAIDFEDHKATISGHALRLTVTEFSLLGMLVRRAGKLVRHHELLLNIWGRDDADSRTCLRVYTCMLRKKLRKLLAQETLLTEPGVGYRLAAMA
jgi:two-component system KDP operon response regulator KdpE